MNEIERLNLIVGARTEQIAEEKRTILIRINQLSRDLLLAATASDMAQVARRSADLAAEMARIEGQERTLADVRIALATGRAQ